MPFAIQSGSKCVFIGDSITDCGRSQPVGEGLFNALGNGYVCLVDALIATTYPEAKLRIVNMGTSGNTVRDLDQRWQRDVLDLRPDWLSIMIGINDVWRQLDCPTQTENHVMPDEYANTLERLIETTKPALKGLILAAPFYIEANRRDQMRSRMDEYGTIVRALATRHDAIFVDTQAAFNRVLAHTYSANLAWDRVHPTQTGVAVLTRAFLNSIGFEWCT